MNWREDLREYQIREYLGEKFKVNIQKMGIISILSVNFGPHLLKLHTFTLEIPGASGLFSLGCT